MTPPHRFCSFALSFALMAISPVAGAWSELGHALVGELAERELSDATRAQVQALLEGEPVPSLAGVASWADEVRERPDYAWSSRMHYVNIRDSGCRYDAARDCVGDACVVAAIPRFAAVLADTSRPRDERREALKFLVHFVGDIHQPLHAGHRSDRGGNEFQIHWRGEGTNLHAIWDYHLLASAGLGLNDYADRLQAQERDDPATAFIPPGFSPAYVTAWAELSCSRTDNRLYPEKPGKLPPTYIESMRGEAELRVIAAGHALAQLLEATLGAKPATAQ